MGSYSDLDSGASGTGKYIMWGRLINELNKKKNVGEIRSRWH
jgi:hypothetical protein